MASSETYGIYHDLEIQSTSEKVFRAISQPEDLINWWPLKCSGTPEPGALYNFYFGPKYNWYGEVTKAVQNKSFYIRMTESDANWDATTFGFNLDSDGNKVKLKFSHSNWPERNEHFRISSFCWALLLKGLKDYVEHNIIIPFENRS